MAITNLLATKDNEMVQQLPNNNYGGFPPLRVGMSSPSANRLRRSLLGFNGSALVGKTVTLATLYIYYYTWWGSDPVGRQWNIFKITRSDWTELGACWNKYAVGLNWATPGGDYVTSNPAGASAICPATPLHWVTWDITDIARDAVDNEGGFINVLLRDNDEVGLNNKLAGFHSRESPNVPYVAVTYEDKGACFGLHPGALAVMLQ